jgi:hypothetical protein
MTNTFSQTAVLTTNWQWKQQLQESLKLQPRG